ncbi:MAG: hypothetical protein ACTHNP_08320 [Solirubrobacterales bacterium]
MALASAGSSSAIHGCYSKRTGVLRVANTCRHGEKRLVWNQTITGPQGPRGAEGAVGPAGAAGSARAYAYVNGSVSSPSFNAQRTRGFSAVSEPAKGVYCLTAPGIDPATTAPAVTAVYNSGFAGVPTSAKLEARGEGCAAGQFEVLTQDIQSGSEVDSPNLDFTIVVP